MKTRDIFACEFSSQVCPTNKGSFSKNETDSNVTAIAL